MRQRYFFGTENGMIIWDVDSMLKAIEEKPMAFELRMVDTDYIAKENHDARVDDTYAMKTDLNKPCVLAEVKDGHYLLLDGNHRLRKAIKEKLSCVMCYCLKEPQHQRYIEHYRPKEYEHIMSAYE